MYFKRIVFATLLLAGGFSAEAAAFDISSLLNGNTIQNLIEGVLTKSDISVADMAGTWQIDGSAVSFKSENALAKAGGVAIAAGIEAKLDPYYKQYGLTGGSIKITEDGQFTMSMSRLNLSGTITKKDNEGTFDFNFKVLGMSIASMTTYVQKSPSKLEIMFDATKLKSLLSSISKIAGSASSGLGSLASAAGTILDQYEGLCVGFGLTQTASAEGSGASESGSNSLLPDLLKNFPAMKNNDSNVTKQVSTDTPKSNTVKTNVTKSSEAKEASGAKKEAESQESDAESILNKMFNRLKK